MQIIKSDSSELLVENHFDKKDEGRGGAIFIHPSYEYDDDSCNSPINFISKVDIKECQFKNNNGFDGYGMYFEGDEPNHLVINIMTNDFIDNCNKNNHNENEHIIYGAVITTELFSISEQQINQDNNFKYCIPDLYVRNISYVDQYSKALKQGFSQSNGFAESNTFPTKYFTDSFAFTKTFEFSQSNEFKETDSFSQSNEFKETEVFSLSNNFSPSLTISNKQTFDISTEIIKETKTENIKETQTENIKDAQTENIKDTLTVNIKDTHTISSTIKIDNEPGTSSNKGKNQFKCL